MRHGTFIALAAVLLACAAVRLWPLQFDYFHPDEVIAVEVAQEVADSGSLDTNWKKADLPQDFKLPQYNFSGYLLSAAAVDGILKLLPVPEPRNTLKALRLWSALLAIGSVVLTFVAGRKMFGVAAALVATLLVMVNPLLAQDGFYARPEPFVTVLTLIFIIGVPGPTPIARVFMTGIVGGVLVATKVSMLALLPLLLAPGAEGLATAGFAASMGAYARRVGRNLPRRLAAGVGGIVVGFALAAPFALVNRDDYMAGVRFLFNQYATPQWPYGLGEASAWERVSYVFDYFSATTGTGALLLAIVGAVLAGVQRNFRAALIFLCALAFAARFATTPTFFERNLSHVMPIVLIFASFGLVRLAKALPARIPPPVHALAFAALIALAGVSAARTTGLLLTEEINGKSWRELGQLRAEMTRAHEAELTILGADQHYTNLGDGNFQICSPWLIEIPHYHGRESDAALPEALARTGFKEVGRFESHFSYVPTSSLHTYVMPTRLYLYRSKDAAGCIDDAQAADPRSAAPPLEIEEIEADPTWTRGGGFPTSAGFAPEVHYGTWSWTAPQTGTIRMKIKTEGRREILLPYQTGPQAKGLALRVTDPSGAALATMSPLPISAHWTYARIPLPPDTAGVIIEAVDSGNEAADWIALGPPHAVKR